MNTLGLGLILTLMAGCGGGSSKATPPAAPTLASIAPQTALAGGPGFTLTATGASFTNGDQVQWNGSPRFTTYVSATELQAAILAQDLAAQGTTQVTVLHSGQNPATSSAQTFRVTANGLVLQAAPSNDLVWDPWHGVLYASLAASAGAAGPALAVINPSTGQITATVPTGCEPGRLALAGDGSCLYVGLDALSSVQRFLLPALTPDLSIALGADLDYGPYYAVDMQVAPGAPHTLAVNLGSKVTSPASVGGLVIYDDARHRPVKTASRAMDGSTFGSLQWGADASALYCADYLDDGFTFMSFGVSAQGVLQTGYVPRAFSSFFNQIHFDPATRLVYADSGQVVAPDGGELAGFFQTSQQPMDPTQIMVPDGTVGRAFFLGVDPGNSGNYLIQAFDLEKFQVVASNSMPNGATGGFPLPNRLVRWGQSGLAYGGNGSPVGIVTAPSLSGEGTAVAAPTLSSLAAPSALFGGPARTVDVLGTGFHADSSVQWNGSPRLTTFLSGSHLQAAITAQDLVSPGSAQVTVLNPASEGGGSNPATFVMADLQSLVLPVPTNDLALDPVTGMLYASLPSTAGNLGNTIITVDPLRGTITSSLFVGSEPHKLAVSGDGQFLYVGLDDQAVIKRYLLPAMTLDLVIPLGTNLYEGPYLALDFQVAPGAPHTLAVSLGSNATIPQGCGGIVIFDDTVPRPTWAMDGQGTTHLYDSLQWGLDAATLYAGNCEVSGWDFYALSVTPGGVSLGLDRPGAFIDFFDFLHFDPGTGLVYGDYGEVLNPVTGASVRTFPAAGRMVPDPTLGKAFFLGEDPSGHFTLTSFALADASGLRQATMTTMAPNGLFPTRILRWGGNGLAFGGGGAPMGIVSGPFVPGY